MTPLDAFNWAFDRIAKDHQTIRRCEDARLDPPAEPTIKCLYCEGRGYYKQPHCAGTSCTFMKRCPCPCQSCSYVECDICGGDGEIAEPEEWKDDAYWENKWDERNGK